MGIMEVGEHQHELTEKCCLMLDRNLAIVAAISCSENCLQVSAMLYWSTVMVFRIVLYSLYHLS